MSGLKLLHDSLGEWRGPRHFLLCGVRVPAYGTVDPNFERDLPLFQTRPDDVFVVSYPKSGTTWLQEIAWQIVHNGDTSTVRINNRVPFLEDSKLFDCVGDGDVEQNSHGSLERFPSPRLIKSHLPFNVIPKGNNKDSACKYVYIARNPKDVAVSFYHFLEGFGEDISGFRGPWEFYADLFLQGRVCYGSWLDHVLGWWKEKDNSNILFLKYEDLKKDLLGNVKKVADFVGKPLSPETVRRIADQCSFQGMSKNAATYWVYDSPRGPKYMRKGKVGDWKNHFSTELSAKYDKELVARLEGTGLKFELNT